MKDIEITRSLEIECFEIAIAWNTHKPGAAVRVACGVHKAKIRITRDALMELSEAIQEALCPKSEQ